MALPYIWLGVWLKDGSTVEANVNGSSAAATYKYTVAAGDLLELERMLIYIKDFGKFDADLYGNGAILTNGILITIERADGSSVDLVDGEPVKTNAHWAALCHDLVFHDTGTGDVVATARWTFARAGGPLVLEAGDSIEVVIQDNLTVLTGHRFQIQGLLF
jgi:hypothetical protein